LIRSDAAAGTGRQRFEREAQATAALRSPHTVEVYEFGVSEGGEIYYVMELLDGFDVEHLVTASGPQPAARVVGWLRQACHSLYEAHQAGIIHRDIKPANLFVCRYGQDHDFLKVLDFGLATLAPAFDAKEAMLTGENKVMGTPAYMPPEAATGKSPVDARSDLYALGCVAYFALTGKRPFEADSAVEMILGHVDKEPVPPSEVAEVDIPKALESLVLECMAKDPADRPQSARELRDRLDDLPVWSDDQARDWWQRRAGSSQ
jgi:serine/threonine-protein kinase